MNRNHAIALGVTGAAALILVLWSPWNGAGNVLPAATTNSSASPGSPSPNPASAGPLLGRQEPIRNDQSREALERPIIEPSIKNSSLDVFTKDFVLLARPALRDVEVLVHSGDNRWWKQETIRAGTRTVNIYLGSDISKPGEAFQVVALTTDQPLQEQNFLEIPTHRTSSEVITLYRR